ncbi:hypothetical protein, partial [Campylobacter jejuni]
VEKVAKEHKKTKSYTGYYLDLELKNARS